MLRKIILCFVINAIFVVNCQTDSLTIASRIKKVVEYRNLINQSFEKFYEKDYEFVMQTFSKLDLSISFNEDLELYTRSMDSLIKIGKDSSNFYKIRNEINYIKKRVWDFKYLAFDNELINHGHFVDKKKRLDNDTICLSPKESLLMSITILDRYNDELRNGKLKKEKIINQLFVSAAQNAFNILIKEDLPFRVIGSVWNDDLSLALIHCIKSLNKKEGELFLSVLKKHVLLGNIHPHQYAVFYDVYFGEINHGLSYYGTTFYRKYEKKKTSNFRRELYCVQELSTLKVRREEILLPVFEYWLYYQNLTYDYNCNRHR